MVHFVGRWLAGLFARWRTARQATADQLFEAYCPNCGGTTLRRDDATGRVSCPQCG